MFAKSEGPTALRADLVRALAFSEAKIERPETGESVESVAALASVWNGRKGYVALLVRDVLPPRVDRYVTENAITSVETLDAATEEGVAFAESLGFQMDSPRFADLSEDEREARLHKWNKLRKVRKPAAASSPLEDTGQLVIPEPPPMHAGLEISPEDLAVPAPPPIPDIEAEIETSAADIVATPSDPEADTSLLQPGSRSAVLGRISLVRKGGADARRQEQLARLLAFF
ncbi:MAG TPA: hypothetical protein VMR31_00890 [Myxococcota bacterium]|nr:hypothetical protein [Myxococcota bacterium]